MGINKNELLSKIKAKRTTIHLDSLDADITLKGLPAGDVLNLTEQLNRKQINQNDFTFEMIVLSVIDDNGEPLFDLDMAKELDVEVLTEIAEAVAKYNKLDTKKVATENLKKVGK
jgi:hypothetical protein